MQGSCYWKRFRDVIGISFTTASFAKNDIKKNCAAVTMRAVFELEVCKKRRTHHYIENCFKKKNMWLKWDLDMRFDPFKAVRLPQRLCYCKNSPFFQI